MWRRNKGKRVDTDMSATSLRTSINADLMLLSEEKLKSVSQYVRLLVLHHTSHQDDGVKLNGGLRRSLDALRKMVKDSGKSAEEIINEQIDEKYNV